MHDGAVNSIPSWATYIQVAANPTHVGDRWAKSLKIAMMGAGGILSASRACSKIAKQAVATLVKQ